MKPIEIAPLIFAATKRKNWKVSQALCDNAWVTKTVLDNSSAMQFIDLWTVISNISLVPEEEDDIVWKLTPNGQYSAKSVYDMQFPWLNPFILAQDNL
jgi:hypothetical protein